MTLLTPPIVRAVGLRKSFGATEVLKGIDLEVAQGEVLCILGPSGSGKSTLLRCINHLEVPNGGYVWVDGQIIGYDLRDGVLHELPIKQLRAQQSHLGMVFQHFNLFAHRTVLGNVIEGPMVVRGLSREAATTRAMDLLRLVGLADKGDRLPEELSGGEQQRVAIARAFVNRPGILLADEPTGNLDPVTSVGIMKVFDRIHRDGTTVLMATHDATIVDQMRRRVLELHSGELVRDQAQGVYGYQ